MSTISTFLMFSGEQLGKAEEAVRFYTSLFPGSEIGQMELYGPEGPEPEGTVKMASFTLNGQHFKALDSHHEHAFGFTPAVSLFVEFDSREETEIAFAKLSAGGQVLMPLQEYPFSRNFGWVQDRYGISWQLKFD